MRRVFVYVAAVAVLSACGGGGSSSGPMMPPGSSQSVGGQGATASPVPTATPSGPPSGVTLSGPLSRTDVYTYPTPSPLPSTQASGTATETTDFSTAPNPYGSGTVSKYHTVLTQAYPTQTQWTTTDAYYLQGATSGGVSPWNLLGYTTTDEQGNVTTMAYAPAFIADELPERSGQSWSNAGAGKLHEAFVDLETIDATYAADGSFQENESLYATATSSAATVSVKQNADGSGSFTSTFLEQGGYNQAQFIFSVAVSAPKQQIAGGGGIIAVTAAESEPLALPAPSPTPLVAAAIPSWYSAAGYHETVKDLGSASVPSSCNLPPSIAATSATHLQHVIADATTPFGVLETTNVDEYIAAPLGTVCAIVSDVTKEYYDFGQDVYNAQYGAPMVPVFSSVPLHTTTITQTLGLQSARYDQAAKRVSDARMMSSIAPAQVQSLILGIRAQARVREAHRLVSGVRHLYSAYHQKPGHH